MAKLTLNNYREKKRIKRKGVSKRRVSFACRFAGMAGAMKDAKGEPTKKAMALKKWGFGHKIWQSIWERLIRLLY